MCGTPEKITAFKCGLGLKMHQNSSVWITALHGTSRLLQKALFNTLQMQAVVECFSKRLQPQLLEFLHPRHHSPPSFPICKVPRVFWKTVPGSLCQPHINKPAGEREGPVLLWHLPGCINYWQRTDDWVGYSQNRSGDHLGRRVVTDLSAARNTECHVSPNAGSLLLVLHEYLVSCNCVNTPALILSSRYLNLAWLMNKREECLVQFMLCHTEVCQKGMALSQLSLVGRLLSLCSRALKVWVTGLKSELWIWTQWHRQSLNKHSLTTRISVRNL